MSDTADELPPLSPEDVRRSWEALRQMALHPQPGDRWPREPPSPADGGGTAGDREPRDPSGPDGQLAASAETPDRFPEGP